MAHSTSACGQEIGSETSSNTRINEQSTVTCVNETVQSAAANAQLSHPSMSSQQSTGHSQHSLQNKCPCSCVCAPPHSLLLGALSAASTCVAARCPVSSAACMQGLMDVCVASPAHREQHSRAASAFPPPCRQNPQQYWLHRAAACIAPSAC